VRDHGNWGNGIKEDVQKIINYYKSKGVTSFGIFGFCWGGRVSCSASCELEDIKCSVLLHPSQMVITDAENVKCPMLLLPTKDEPDLVS